MYSLVGLDVPLVARAMVVRETGLRGPELCVDELGAEQSTPEQTSCSDLSDILQP